jgi:hypothetical protein
VISQAGKQRGYNAMFITDHQAGSNLATSTVIANHVEFDDSFGSKWITDFYGAPSTRDASLAAAPVRSGTSSLHVEATAPSSGESFIRLKRGPNLRSGDPILRFSAFPARVDAGSGLYVSASLGGDVTEGVRNGYTTQGGTVAPGRSTVFVWQLGSARTPSPDPNARVVVNDLPFTRNVWNDYEINMATGAVKRNGVVVKPGGGGLQSLAPAERPLDYNALQVMKMAAAASGGGSAEGYFDRYSLDASAPVPGGEEFTYRNSGMSSFNGPDFRLYPSIEMGFNRHVQRFNFGIAGAAEYNAFFQCDEFGDHCRITKGIDGILPTQQTGYPAQLNHPNLPGGVKDTEMAADEYRAFGADVMEVREDVDGVTPDTMIEQWDEVLKRGRALVGTWSSDMHKVESLDVGYRGVATYIRAPSLGFDDLMRSLYEGRAYMARNTFDGTVVFNLDRGSAEPHPARYPVRVSDGLASADVHLAIGGPIPAGARVEWISNDAVVASDTPPTTGYENTKAISLAGASTYVRAELRDASGERIAMTEPIMFADVAGLPAGARLGVDGVTTASGRDYTRIATRGITGASYDAAARALALTLEDPPAAASRMTMETGPLVPASVHVDGLVAPQVSGPAALDTAPGSAWAYDATAHRLSVRARHSTAVADVHVQFQGTPDTQAPSRPATLSATAAAPKRVELAWAAASDDRAVAGYRVRRGPCGSGGVIATVGASVRSYADTTLAPGATAAYEVEAFDAAGNVSPRSPCATATTPTTATATFSPVADSYVQADTPPTNYGAAAKLRADASPDVRSYLRFDLSGLEGTVTKATLVMTAATASTSGYQVRGVADTSWSERLLNYSNAPAMGALPIGSTLGFALGATPSVDVTSAVTGNGAVGFALTTTSSSAFSLSSREAGAAAPKLVVETTAAAEPPPPPPPPSGVFTFAPVADSYVQADTPATNYGTAAKLRADASPDTRGYLRFDVSGLTEPVSRATLVFNATSASSRGFDVRSAADTTWGERLITFANAPPAAATPLGASPPFATGDAPAVDVTAAVAGNGPVAFAVTTSSTTALSLASREAGTGAPRLVVETGSD